jgi:hypothetical protein
VRPSECSAVPFPRTSATPTEPLKSVIDDGSAAGPKETKWKLTPLMVVVLGVGLGAGLESAVADPVAGHSSPVPSEAPVAATAAPPMKARRESLCRAKCDNGESVGTGHWLLSMLDVCMGPTPNHAKRHFSA